MNKFAKIAIDVPLNKVNRKFDYAVPKKLQNCLSIGQAVLVPFGRRNVIGFITGFSRKTDVKKSKIKKINSLVREDIFFNKKQLELYEWISDYYNTYLTKVIYTAIPTGVVKGRVDKKRKKYYRLSQSTNETAKIINKIKDKAPKQAEVLKVLYNNPDTNFTIKELTEKADTYHGAVYSLRDKEYIEVFEGIKKRRPFLESSPEEKQRFAPTRAQAKAIKAVSTSLNNNSSDVFLLHGVTGSGKTEVYLQLVERLLKKDQGAIILVPEISLAPVMVRRFYSRFGDKIAVLHSSLSLGERYDEWRRLKKGEAKIAIGARSAIFAPVKNPGLLIIDEEHENSYKQGSYPHYHARKVAEKMADIHNVPLLLGSATPSLKSYYKAKNDNYKYLNLPQRVANAKLPPVNVIDMREELKEGNYTIFSNKLYEKIEKALKRDEQILLFINRRGYSNFVLCRECGHVIRCNNCDISLTYHSGQNILKCHYCDFGSQMPAVCPECNSRYIKKFGMGTEKIEEEVKNFFPEAEVDRMDVDTTTRKGSHHRILSRLEEGKTDILVGTQMIAKGHDYPNISVVGIITADTLLNLPDFRSSERTFQLLTQVAGRTGRGDKLGEVVVQTYTPDHYSIKAAREHDYYRFYQQEIELRKMLEYPPFIKMVNILVSGENENHVIEAAQKLGVYMDDFTGSIKEVLGPGPAPIEKIKKKYRWQIILRFEDHKKRKKVLKAINQNFLPYNKEEVKFNIDVDPLSML